MIRKCGKAIAKPSSLLLLFANALLLVEPYATKAQERLAPAAKTQSTEYICHAQLGEAIDTVINRPQFRRSRWGILIEPLSRSQPQNSTLYSHNAQSYFIPASNVKLLTTAAALRKLGGDYRIRTSVYGTVGVAGPTVLYVTGRGDPSLTDAKLRGLAQQLKRQGVSQIQQLILQDNYFTGPTLNPNWEWEDVQAYYGAPVNSLIVNQNALLLTLLPQQLKQPLKVNWGDRLAVTQWQVENESVTSEAGSASSVEVTGELGKPVLRIRGQLAVDAKPEVMALAVLDPSKYFLEHFQRALALEGITVARALVASARQNTTPELAVVESPPLATLVLETNLNSNNLYAEALLRTLGAKNGQDTPRAKTTAEAGLAVVKQTLTELEVNPESYVLTDGSGLSRHNLVSPEALVQTLRAIAQTPEAAIYQASLPVAGKSGTLKNRFRNTPAQGIVRAKTGTVSGVSSLSGYINAPDYQPLVFSIIVNQSDKSVATVRQAIDEIVVLLTRLRRC